MQETNQSANEGGFDATTRLPVGVIMVLTGGRWELNGAVVGKRFASDRVQRAPLRQAEDSELWLWTGLHLRLRMRYVDDYALNINDDAPALFVVCGRDAEGVPVPRMVTVSPEEAQGSDATDLRSGAEEVLRTGMPPEVYRWLERFVLDNYKPRRKGGKKKRRTDPEEQWGRKGGQ